MTFAPNRVLITDITQANPAVVTCASNHNLTTGQVIRLNIPTNYGMQQLNNLLLQITYISAMTFSLQYHQAPPAMNVNSIEFQPFVNAGTGTPAAFVAVGSAPTPVLSPPVYANNNVCISTIEDQLVNNSKVPIPF